MGTSRLQVRAFGTAGLSTICLFAIAALIPDDAIAFVAWLSAVLVGIPVSILTRVYFARAAVPAGQSAPSAFRHFRRSLGVLSILLGVVTLGWQAYSLVVQQLPEILSLTTFSLAVFAVALIGLGHRLSRSS